MTVRLPAFVINNSGVMKGLMSTSMPQLAMTWSVINVSNMTTLCMLILLKVLAGY